MLERALGFAADSVTYADLEAKLTLGEYESDLVDFKKELPGSGGKARKELARDVASMANSRGGVLLFGVAEKGDRVVSLPGVSLEGDSLPRALAALVCPKVHGLATLPIENPSTPGKGILGITVPQSPLAPHCVMYDGSLGYWRRVGRENLPMPEHEVEREYRNRILLKESLATEAGRIADHATAGSSGCLWAVGVPLTREARVFWTPQEGRGIAETVVRSASFDPQARHSTTGWQTAVRFRRVVTCSAQYQGRAELESFTIHDSGAVSCVFALTEPTDSNLIHDAMGLVEGRVSPRAVHYTRCLELAANSVCTMRDIWQHAGLAGPAILAYGMKAPTDVCWLDFDGGFWNLRGRCGEELASDQGLDSASLVRPAPAGRLIGRIITDLASGFGRSFAGHPPADLQGAINIAHVPDPKGVSEWCQAKGLAVYDSRDSAATPA